MEKESVFKFPRSYEKLSGNECACKTEHRSSKIAHKFWYCFAVVVAVALIIASASIWCLTTEVAALQKKVSVLQMVAKEDLQVVFNLGQILRSHMKTTLNEKLKTLNDMRLDDEENLFSAYNFPSTMKKELVDGSSENNMEEHAEDYTDEDDRDNYYESQSEIIWFDKDARRGNKGAKKKREIRKFESSEENAPKIPLNETEAKSSRVEKLSETSTQKSSTEMQSSEKSNTYSSREKFIPSTHILPKKIQSHRKHRKSWNGSAEKFITEIHSTSAAPIHVRRSRTKATDSHEIERKPWLNNQMFQQHTSSIKDTVSKEDVAHTKYDKYFDDNDNRYLDHSKEELHDALSYNMITIHFSADTSHYSRERDSHYFGNGRMQIQSEVYKDWKPAHWTQGVGMSKYFHLNQGRVTVSTKGIYLIYAQIQYSNVQEVNGFSVFRNNEIVVQCITTSTHPDKQEIKSNTCGISTTILLQSNDSICIKDLHHGRYVVLTPEKSYFGLVLLSPFKK